MHLAGDDPFASRPAALWQADAGHAGLADHHPAVADQTWQRVTVFLSAL